MEEYLAIKMNGLLIYVTLINFQEIKLNEKSQFFEMFEVTCMTPFI